MPKYWGKQIFSLGSLPEMGQNQKTENKEREREIERLKVGNNNVQLQMTIAASGAGWHTQAAWINKHQVV